MLISFKFKVFNKYGTFIKSYILILFSICDGARVRHRRPTGPAMGVPGRVHHRRPAGSLVPCTGGTGTAVLWLPARAVRARPFSGSQHGGSVAWRRSAALLQVREEEEEDRGEKRKREEKRSAWPGGGALHCCRRKKRRKRTEEKRKEEKRREERSWLELIKIRISFFLLRLSRVFKQEVLSLVFSHWRCWGNQIMKQKPGGGGGGGVEACDFTVSEGHGLPLVAN